jgi:hypothetical protein
MDDELQTIKTIFLSFYPIIYILGFFGNVLSLIVFSQKRFKNTLFDVYFRALNLIYSFTITYTLFDYFNYQFNVNIQTISWSFCHFNLYLIYSIAPVAAWLLVVISFDRMLSTKYPSRYLMRKNKKIQILICVFLLIFNLIYYMPMAVYQNYEETYNNLTNMTDVRCTLDDSGIVYWMDLFNSTLIPFIFMTAFSTLTVRHLFKSRLNISNRINQKDYRFAITSISMNVCFFVLNSPIVIVPLIFNYVVIDSKLYDLFYVISIIPYYIDFGLIFYINIFVNSLFRQQFYETIYSKLKLNNHC